MAAKKKKATPLVMRAHDVEGLLRVKYADYFYRSEMQGVKGNGRLDGIAIRPSWAHPEVHGFEIKVSRRDFIQDDKWTAYLPSCKQFWFVTGPGIVDKAEIPEQAGWIEASAQGARLLIRKKAPVRKMTPEDEAHLFRRIIHGIHYAGQRAPWNGEEVSAEDRLRLWLKEKEDKATLSGLVSAKIRRIVGAVNERNHQLQVENASLKELKAACDSLGVNLDDLIKKNRGLGKYPEYHWRQLIRKHAPELIPSEIPEELKALKQAGRLIEQACGDIAGRVTRAADALVDAMKELEEGKLPEDSE